MENSSKTVHPAWRTVGLIALGVLLFGGGLVAGMFASGRMARANRVMVGVRAMPPMMISPRVGPDRGDQDRFGRPNDQKPDDWNDQRPIRPEFEQGVPFNVVPGSPNQMRPGGFIVQVPNSAGNVQVYGFDMNGEVVPDESLVPANGETLTLDNAVKVAEAYLTTLGDDNLALNEVIQFEKYFYATITEKDSGRGAFSIVINPKTTAVGYEPGPSLTWNLKYGLLGVPVRLAEPGDPFEGVDGTSMTVSADEAKELAQAKLDTFDSLREVEGDGLVFYGFYTFKYSVDGKVVAGLISVNGYTGRVVLHDWNGTLVEEKSIQ